MMDTSIIRPDATAALLVEQKTKLQEQLIFFSDYHGDQPKLGWFNIFMAVALASVFSGVSKPTCSFLLTSGSPFVQNLNSSFHLDQSQPSCQLKLMLPGVK